MSVQNNMDLEEEIALLKKENEKLKIDMINHTTQNYSEWKKEQETLAIGLVREDLKRAEEENKELKEENEELKDGENTAKMIDKLNKEFSELQDKNIKLEEELKEANFFRGECGRRMIELEGEMDSLYDYTEYPDPDYADPDYSKADGIGEWMCAREEQISDLQEENKEWKERSDQFKDLVGERWKEIKELKEIQKSNNHDIKGLEELREAIRKELNVEPDPTQTTIMIAVKSIKQENKAIRKYMGEWRTLMETVHPSLRIITANLNGILKGYYKGVGDFEDEEDN